MSVLIWFAGTFIYVFTLLYVKFMRFFANHLEWFIIFSTHNNEVTVMLLSYFEPKLKLLGKCDLCDLYTPFLFLKVLILQKEDWILPISVIIFDFCQAFILETRSSSGLMLNKPISVEDSKLNPPTMFISSTISTMFLF